MYRLCKDFAKKVQLVAPACAGCRNEPSCTVRPGEAFQGRYLGEAFRGGIRLAAGGWDEPVSGEQIVREAEEAAQGHGQVQFGHKLRMPVFVFLAEGGKQLVGRRFAKEAGPL